MKKVDHQQPMTKMETEIARISQVLQDRVYLPSKDLIEELIENDAELRRMQGSQAAFALQIEQLENSIPKLTRDVANALGRGEDGRSQAQRLEAAKSDLQSAKIFYESLQGAVPSMEEKLANDRPALRASIEENLSRVHEEFEVGFDQGLSTPLLLAQAWETATGNFLKKTSITVPGSVAGRAGLYANRRLGRKNRRLIGFFNLRSRD